MKEFFGASKLAARELKNPGHVKWGLRWGLVE